MLVSVGEIEDMYANLLQNKYSLAGKVTSNEHHFRKIQQVLKDNHVVLDCNGNISGLGNPIDVEHAYCHDVEHLRPNMRVRE
jgi:hypothetical protein